MNRKATSHQPRAISKMSRIGKKPVSVPSGVRVTIDTQSRAVTVEGPKGKLSMIHRAEVSVTWDERENRIICSIGPEQMKVQT